jgi:hypothetical protein
MAADKTLEVYTFAGDHITTVAPKKGSSRWSHKPGEDGSGAFRALGTLPAAALGEDVVVRINNGTDDIFAFVPTDKHRRALDSPGTTEVDLSGPGVRHLLHAGQIYQEDTSDCAEAADTRWFGWMSGAYDDDAWSLPVSFGTFKEGPWQTPRPENWVAPISEYISFTLDPVAAQTDWGARATINLAGEGDFILCIAADDEYRVWIDGTEIMSTMGGGPFQWRRFQQRPLKLCAGTHTIAIQVRNLARPAGLESTNFTWLQFVLAPAGADGKPRSANQVWKVFHDHSGGTFTLGMPFGFTTAALAWDATAATIQAALEAMAIPGAGNVTVTGTNTLRNEKYSISHNHTGGSFTLTAFGQTTGPIAHNATALAVEVALETSITKLNENVTVTGTGTSGDPWLVEFDNQLTLTAVELTGNGGGLTGGTTFTLSNPQNAANDPWVITFGGDLASSYVPLTVNGTNLTGGTAIVADEWQRGRGADAVLRSNTTDWVVRDFTAGTPGLTATEMLLIVDDEVRARGESVFNHITEDFTAATDTDGNTLPEHVLPVSLEADVHRLAVLLEEAGYLVDVAPDLALQCWADRGTDLSGSISLTAWSPGVRDLDAGQAEGNVKNVLRVRTGQGWHEVIDDDSVTARGRWEDGTILDGFATEAEADMVTAPLVRQYATPPRTTTLELTSAGPVVPYDDLDMCDIVTSSAWAVDGYDETGMRWVGVVARIEDTHTVYAIELIS